MKKGQETVPSGGKKSKQANTQANQIPHVAVCEQAVSACVTIFVAIHLLSQSTADSSKLNSLLFFLDCCL